VLRAAYPNCPSLGQTGLTSPLILLMSSSKTINEGESNHLQLT
jgi:hypothetical protein